MSLNKKPILRMSYDTEAYWMGCQRQELLINRCMDCHAWHHFPRWLCPVCWSEKIKPVAVSGLGKVVMFSLTGRRPVAWIELVEQVGLRIYCALVEVEPSNVRIGMEVRLGWEDYGESFLPVFRPLNNTGASLGVDK
ncbi:MAG: OB-fold domain-containing protein [Pseudomonadales bacterium]|nr:OB-fold domain-containing protein [Pseudomonadales bacterium]